MRSETWGSNMSRIRTELFSNPPVSRGRSRVGQTTRTANMSVYSAKSGKSVKSTKSAAPVRELQDFGNFLLPGPPPLTPPPQTPSITTFPSAQPPASPVRSKPMPRSESSLVSKSIILSASKSREGSLFQRPLTSTRPPDPPTRRSGPFPGPDRSDKSGRLRLYGLSVKFGNQSSR